MKNGANFTAATQALNICCYEVYTFAAGGSLERKKVKSDITKMHTRVS